MLKMLFRVLMIFTMASILSCSSGNAEIKSNIHEIINDTIDESTLGILVGNKIIIEEDVDLKGNVCNLSTGKNLVFKGGVIKNGTLNGNMTKIECKGKVFNKVSIRGSWNVPEISTNLFVDLGYENSLRDVVALAHPRLHNRIIIEKGDYIVKAEKDKDVCIPIRSNTDLILKGTIKLAPNNHKSYDIIQAKGENINIKGNGTIIGDKHTHTGTDGEWGMGINLKGAINTTINGLTIKDCWGDCIYVGGNSQNVLIERCKLDHGRRQGISVTKAFGVTIKYCTIKNVGGTDPEYAIDIEPNKRDSVDNILIEKVIVKECEGGFLVVRKKQKDSLRTPWIGKVTIRNCQVTCKSKVPVAIKRCEDVIIEKCILYVREGKPAIGVTETGKAVVENNKANIERDIVGQTKNSLKRLAGKTTSPIYVKETKQSIVRNNIIVER